MKKLGESGMIESVIYKQGLANSFGGLGLQEITSNRRFNQLCLRGPVVLKPQHLYQILCVRDLLRFPDFALHMVNIGTSAIYQLFKYAYAQITDFEVWTRRLFLFIIR
jgi:hypothetical protein